MPQYLNIGNTKFGFSNKLMSPKLKFFFFSSITAMLKLFLKGYLTYFFYHHNKKEIKTAVLRDFYCIHIKVILFYLKICIYDNPYLLLYFSIYPLGHKKA